MFKIAFANSTKSTQISLINAIKNGFNEKQFALAAINQHKGIGTNNRIWEGTKTANFSSNTFKSNYFDEDMFFYGNLDDLNLIIRSNLYCSFYLNKIPSDLLLQSTSIYYAFIFKSVLKNFGSKIFVKWPNDLYLDNIKIGGVLTHKIKDTIICGIGLNIVSSPNYSQVLDIEIELCELLKNYFTKLLEFPSWKSVFVNYTDDFYQSSSFNFKLNDKIYSLESAKLYNDGSILIDNQRIYSLR